MASDRKPQGFRLRSRFGAWWHRGALVALIAASLVLLLINRAEPEIFAEARAAAADLMGPVFDIAAEPIRLTRETFAALQTLADLHAENARLREENARLREWQHVALGLEQRIAGYEALLNVQPAPAVAQLTAQVIAEVGGPFVHALIINAGQVDGARPGQAVVDSGGFIGRVVGVGRHSARVLLLQDLSSRIPVSVEPSNTRAILAGDNSDQPLLEYLPPGVTVNPGDRVVTSGDGNLLPPGLPVGVVTGGPDAYRVVLYSSQSAVGRVRLLHYDFPRDTDVPGDADLVSGVPPGAAGAPAGLR